MFKTNKLHHLAGLIALFVLTACAGAPKTDFDPTINFDNYKTFQWQYADSNSDIDDPIFDSQLFEKKLEVAVTDILFARGLSGSEDPDMTLSYHMASKKRNNYPYVNFAVGYGRYSRNSYWNIYAPHLRSMDVDEVILIVDVKDAANQELIWRGWTKTRERSRPLDQAAVRNLAEKILAGFPPQ